MPENDKLSRRDAIKRIFAGVGGLALLGLSGSSCEYVPGYYYDSYCGSGYSSYWYSSYYGSYCSYYYSDYYDYNSYCSYNSYQSSSAPHGDVW